MTSVYCWQVFKLQFVTFHQIGSCWIIAELWKELQRNFPKGFGMGLAIQELQYFNAYATRELNDGAYQAEAYEARPKCNYARLLGVAYPAEQDYVIVKLALNQP